MRLFILIFVIVVGLNLNFCSENGTNESPDATQDEITNKDVSDTQSGPQEIKVKIIADKESGNAPLEVHFDAEVTGIPEDEIEYLWDFDNGSTSTEKSPVVYFTEPGNYMVKLKATKKGTILYKMAEKLIKVFEPADLKLSDVSITSPTKIAPGDSFTLSFSVLNDGGKVENPFHLKVYLSLNEVFDDKDIEVKDITIDGIAGGPYIKGEKEFKDLEVTVPKDTKDGNYFVFVYVDANQEIPEKEESNNIKAALNLLEVDISVSFKPDLVVESISFPENVELSQGENLNYQMIIKNAGKADAKNFKFAVYISSDNKLDDSDIKITNDESSVLFNLEAGGIRSFIKSYNIPESLSNGQYYLIGTVDEDNTVKEENEDNNTLVSDSTFTVKYKEPQGKDLKIEEFKVGSTIVYFEGSIDIYLTVSNPGTQTINDFDYTVFFAKQPSPNPNTDFIMGTFSGDKLEPKGKIEIKNLVKVKKSVLYEPGDYYVWVYVDKENKVEELDEGNNFVMFPTPIKVTNEANVDVALTDVSFHPTVVDAGQNIKVSFSIKNNGSSSSGAFFAAIVFSQNTSVSIPEVMAGTDFLIKLVPISGIEAGMQQDFVEKIKVPVALPNDISEYYVGVILDYKNSIPKDLDKGNNIMVTDYILKVKNPQGGCFEDNYEPNNIKDEASEIEEGSIENLGLCSGEDWYKIMVDSGTTLTVELFIEPVLSLNEIPYDLNLEVIPAQEGEKKTGNLTGKYEKVVYLSSPVSQYFYIRVFPKNSKVQAHYTLKTTLSSPKPGVDIVVDKLTVYPDTIYPGGLIQAVLELYNIGLSDSGTFNIDYYLSKDPFIDDTDELIKETKDISINGTKSLTLEEKLIMPQVLGGDYYIIAKADSGDDINELNEENNIGVSTKIFVDDNIVCEQDDFEPNDAMKIAYEINGDQGLYSNLYVCPGLDDWYKFNLPFGKSFSATVNYLYKEGKGLITLKLFDSTGQAIIDTSSNPDNPSVVIPYVYYGGTYYLQVTITGDKDNIEPYEYSLGFSIGNPSQSSICKVDSKEFNNSFSEAASLGCGMNNLTLCNKDVDIFKVEVPKGQVFSCELNNASNLFRASIILDPGEPPVEKTNGNGKISYYASETTTIYVLVEPKNPTQFFDDYEYSLFVDGIHGIDLVSEIDSIVPDEVFQGEDTLMTFVISNLCIDDAGSFNYAVYLSEDDTLDESDVLIDELSVEDGLAAKSDIEIKQKFTIPHDTEPGNYFLILDADSQNEVKESNEDNNTSNIEVSVLPVCVDDDFELNDIPEDATVITAKTYNDLMLCKNDYDWYKINLKQGDQLKVELLFDPDQGDLDLRLYSSDDLNDPIAKGFQNENGETLYYNVTKSGYYYIRVSGFLGAENNYSLDVSVE